MKEVDSILSIEEKIMLKSIFENYPDYIQYLLTQTPELCLISIKNGLTDPDFIDIPWTEEMEKEWIYRNI